MGYQVYEDRAAHDLGVTRWAGYGVPAVCDHPDCAEAIDRGLSYRCGDDSDDGCGLSFCSTHLWIGVDDREPQMCERCCDEEPPYAPKPDTAEWEAHMLTDESWKQWRDEHPAETEAMRSRATTTEPNAKRWPCMICGESIAVDPEAALGSPRYKHLEPVVLSSHFAVRGPDAVSPVEPALAGWEDLEGFLGMGHEEGDR